MTDEMRRILIMQLKEYSSIAEGKISAVLQEEIKNAVKKAQEDIDKNKTTLSPSTKKMI